MLAGVLGACDEGHEFTAIGLALATNQASVRTLWLAIHALENDAAGLDYLAGQDHPRASQRQREAAQARDAAQRLRGYAKAAQDRLDALDATVSD